MPTGAAVCVCQSWRAPGTASPAHSPPSWKRNRGRNHNWSECTGTGLCSRRPDSPFFLHRRTGHTGEEVLASQVPGWFVEERRRWGSVFGSLTHTSSVPSLSWVPWPLVPDNPSLPGWVFKKGHVYLQSYSCLECGEAWPPLLRQPAHVGTCRAQGEGPAGCGEAPVGPRPRGCSVPCPESWPRGSGGQSSTPSRLRPSGSAPVPPSCPQPCRAGSAWHPPPPALPPAAGSLLPYCQAAQETD